MKYSITYTAINTYSHPTREGLWQFLVIPENNQTQLLKKSVITNSQYAQIDESVNGFGFKTLRVHLRKMFQEIQFEASFVLKKKRTNPFTQINTENWQEAYKTIEELDFKVTHEMFLIDTPLTQLSAQAAQQFQFDSAKSISDNLIALNERIFTEFTFQTDVTSIETTTAETLAHKKGVCQDFTHLFCGIARANKIPTRYVSGYLHQGSGLVGDMQMHAWAECFIPNSGWIGFDPTNNLLAAENHIKVAHSRDYKDCAPIKGIIYSTPDSTNKTVYKVSVKMLNDKVEPQRIFQEQATPQEYQQHQFQQQWQQQQ